MMIGGPNGDDRGSVDIGGTGMGGSCAVIGRLWELRAQIAEFRPLNFVARPYHCVI
ncbi:MAG: hypothetical protein QOJ66_852 [Ilumatobacteraceae bacterium]